MFDNVIESFENAMEKTFRRNFMWIVIFAWRGSSKLKFDMAFDGFTSAYISLVVASIDFTAWVGVPLCGDYTLDIASMCDAI